MRNSGFTLIELIIAIAIVGIGCLFIVGIYQGSLNPGGAMSFGVNGVVETRCIDGSIVTGKQIGRAHV